MTRRRKSNRAENLMDLVALLPWWAGVVLAIASYWVLHAIATRPLPVAQSAQQIGQLATTAIWQGLATGGQYLLPMICLFGAVMSAVCRRQRRALFDTTSASSSADALQDMSWQQFELLVGEGFRRRGYAVKEVGGGGADGGVDLVLTKTGEKSFVQCKQWKSFKVGVSTVRELYGVMAAHGAAGGFVVTSGRFTQEAAAFTSGRNIRLIDGPALMQLLREARSTAEASPSFSNATVPHGTATHARSPESTGIAQATEPTVSRPIVPHVWQIDGAAGGKTGRRGWQGILGVFGVFCGMPGNARDPRLLMATNYKKEKKWGEEAGLMDSCAPRRVQWLLRSVSTSVASVRN